jgi:hypothetical protein
MKFFFLRVRQDEKCCNGWSEIIEREMRAKRKCLNSFKASKHR